MKTPTAEISGKSNEGTEQYDVDLALQAANGEVVSAILTVREEHPNTLLIIKFHSEEIVSGSETTIWDALLSLRKKLEARGFLICCAGGQLDMSPLPMSYHMSGGHIVSRFILGEREDKTLRQNIFDPIVNGKPASIEDQRAHYQAWLASTAYRPSLGDKILTALIELLGKIGARLI